jgi:hypothetical protein
MACPVISVKKIIPILILVSLTISVITIMSQHITFAQIFLPFNNNNITNPPQKETIMNQTPPAMNQTPPARGVIVVENLNVLCHIKVTLL